MSRISELKEQLELMIVTPCKTDYIVDEIIESVVYYFPEIAELNKKPVKIWKSGAEFIEVINKLKLNTKQNINEE